LTGNWNAGSFDIKATSFSVGANTLTTSEWAYLDGQNQAVKTTDYPLFAGVTLNNISQVSCVGDSLTYASAYTTHLQSHLPTTVWKVNNLGVSGETTTQIGTRFRTQIIDPGDGYCVVLWAGINDVIADESAVDIETRLQALYTDAQNSGLVVVAVTITPFKTHGAWTAGRQTVVDTVNTWILNTATNVNVTVDAYSLLEDPGAGDTLLATYDSGDHLHLSTAGYQAVADLVYSEGIWTPVTTARQPRLSASVDLNQSLRTIDSPYFKNITINDWQSFVSHNPPSDSPTDGFRFYSADVSAGNSCPFFRTENGTVIALNQSLLTTNSVQFAGIENRTGGNLMFRPTANDFNWNVRAVGYSLNFYSGLDDTNPALHLQVLGCVGIGQTSFGTSATKTFAIGTGTAPSDSPADCFQMYSSDEVAGNAVPTFRTEEGVVVKLNQSLLDTDSVIFGTSAVRGTTGGLVLKTAEAAANITASTSVTITLNVPTGAIIHGCQLRVDTALAAGETWNAAYSGGATQTIIHEGAVAKNTKYNSAYESLTTAGTLAAQAAWAANVATAATNITLQRHSDPGVDSFTAEGTIRAIVYYYDFTAMANA
jgi:lysophospholipase L1-like esterase